MNFGYYRHRLTSPGRGAKKLLSLTELSYSNVHCVTAILVFMVGRVVLIRGQLS